jgi:adenylate kinase family enzyme
VRGFERINVVGNPGSGKSTFARELAALLDLPYCEMDALFWKPGWRESSDDEFFPKVRALTSGPRWVLDGNYTRTLAIKWRQVQLVIWLDHSLARTVLRVTARSIRRAITGAELWPGTGNRESLREAFLSRKSIIWLTLTTHRRTRKKYSAMMSSPKYSHITFVRLGSPAAAAAFLEALTPDSRRSDAYGR